MQPKRNQDDQRIAALVARHLAKSRLPRALRSMVPLDCDAANDLLTFKAERVPNRPPNVDAAALRDSVARSVAYLRALRGKKNVIKEVANFHGVDRSYVFRALKEIDPHRWKNIEAAAAEYAERNLAT